jgi:hypothetical protein
MQRAFIVQTQGACLHNGRNFSPRLVLRDGEAASVNMLTEEITAACLFPGM